MDKKLVHSPRADYTDEELVEIFRTKLALRRAEDALRYAHQEWRRLVHFGETRGTTALKTHQIFKKSRHDRTMAKRRVFVAQCAYAKAVEGPAARRALIETMSGMIQERMKEEPFAPKLLMKSQDFDGKINNEEK